VARAYDHADHRGAAVAGARLLAVEDEPNFLLASLRYAGFKVATAAAGTEAVQRHRPDLIVLDVVLPGTDGSKVLRRLPVTEAYGVPSLACEGTAAVVAFGTDFLVIRVDSLPSEVDTEDPAPEWSFVHEGWHVISPRQSRLVDPQPVSHGPLTDW
jgi:Response regulator receiver domain